MIGLAGPAFPGRVFAASAKCIDLQPVLRQLRTYAGSRTHAEARMEACLHQAFSLMSTPSRQSRTRARWSHPTAESMAPPAARFPGFGGRKPGSQRHVTPVSPAGIPAHLSSGQCWCLGLSFQASIWLCLGWSWLQHMLNVARPVYLADLALQVSSFGFPSALPSSQRGWHRGSAWGRVSIGMACALCYLGWTAHSLLLPSLSAGPAAGSRDPLCQGHGASTADGHVCPLPRDLR